MLTMVGMPASDSDSRRFVAATRASPESFGRSVSVVSLVSTRARDDRYACWEEMRARSLPSPTP